MPRGVRAGTDAGRTRAAEGHGRRLIFRTRNRTDPISGFANNISGFANNGDAPGIPDDRIGRGHGPDAAMAVFFITSQYARPCATAKFKKGFDGFADECGSFETTRRNPETKA